MLFKSINPYNKELIDKYSVIPDNKVNKTIQNSYDSFLAWKDFTYKKRASLFYKLNNLIQQKKEFLAEIMALEMGKPIKAGISEIEKCTTVCKYYADETENFLADEYIKSDAQESYIKFQPLGIIFAIMPWNFPFWQVFRFAVPNIMGGNTILLKHAPNVTGCALAIEKLFLQAGFPDGVFSTLIIDIPQVESVIFNKLVKGVTLTGSLNAGKSVASIAGKTAKKSMLELGGSDPYIILDDADLENAVKSCVISRLFNSGQTCISAKRFFVMKSQLKKIEELFVNEMSKFKIGNPLEKNTLFGPLAREDIRDSLHKQVQKSINEGAKCILGGNIPHDKGFFYNATVLTNVKKGITAFDEETFGPVAAIIPVNNEKEAIELANSSQFGLGAAVFTRDIQHGKEVVEKLEVGTCAINDFVRSDPRIPFGGIKNSGYGREISHYGLKEFLNIKSIYIK